MIKSRAEIKSRERWQNCFGVEIIMSTEPYARTKGGAWFAPKYPLSHVKVLPTETDVKVSQNILDMIETTN